MIKETTFQSARGKSENAKKVQTSVKHPKKSILQKDKAIERYLRKVGKRNTVTLPKEIVEMLTIKEGDPIELIKRGNHILIVPMQTIPKDAIYYKDGESDEFITARDLERIKEEGLRDYKEGKLKEYDNAEDMFKDHGW